MEQSRSINTIVDAVRTDTMRDLLREGARSRPDATALLAPGRAPLSYRELASHVEQVAGVLRAEGIGPADRVAVVLPNGPDLATAFLSVAAAAACAPLNPAFTRAEFEFYLRDLQARALLVADGSDGPAHDAARGLGLRVLTIRARAGAGEFDLPSRGEGVTDWPQPGDTGLLLHTSGTTSRPKLVPLSQRNLTASAAQIAAALALTPSDRCLNVMPLFHIHGLMASVLASLRAGASVVCTDGIYAARFFEWLGEYEPTWYTAVPTMHQTILAQARARPELVPEAPLRFIRSSSAALPIAVLEELERVFGAPVVEAYGMTEASHQMASNPLPPRRRKPGSVGVPAGPEIAIMGADRRLLAPGEIGEVVIRGPAVTAGYERNEAATRDAFMDGWFRTGDQGRLDPDGYLFLTGRLKELINRGGEKIAPREVDEMLLAHPSVRQAVCFAVPHAQLGEDVGAAVELHAGTQLTPDDLRRWAAERLPAFKVPRIIRVVDAIPKGPTGKLQRIGLAEALGIGTLDDATRSIGKVEPRNGLEARIAAIWREMLPRAEFGVHDRFEALGGDSLLAATMLAAVSEAEGVTVGAARFVEGGTIAALAEDVAAAGATPLVPVHAGSGAPLYWVPGHENGLLGITRLMGVIEDGPPALAFDLERLAGAATLEELAARCVTLLRAQNAGPYRLAGSCFGGLLAFEAARQLREAGAEVEFLALVDTLYPQWRAQAGPAGVARAMAKQAALKVSGHASALRRLSPADAATYVSRGALAFVKNHGQTAAARLRLDAGRGTTNRGLALRYSGGPYDGAVLLIRIAGRRPEVPALGWATLARGPLEIVSLPRWFEGAMSDGNLPMLAEVLQSRLSAARGAPEAAGR